MKPTRLALAGLTIGIGVIAFAMEPRMAGQAGAQGQAAVQGAPPQQGRQGGGGRGGRGGGVAGNVCSPWATPQWPAQHES